MTVTAYAFSFQCDSHRFCNNQNIKIIWQVKDNNKKSLKAFDFNLDDDAILKQPYTVFALNTSSYFLSDILIFHGFV